MKTLTLSQLNPHEQYPIAFVLGSGIDHTGKLSEQSEYNAVAAAAMRAAKIIPEPIVFAGWGPSSLRGIELPTTEAEAMAATADRLLSPLGVPYRKLLDVESDTTIGNMRALARIAEEHELTEATILAPHASRAAALGRMYMPKGFEIVPVCTAQWALAASIKEAVLLNMMKGLSTGIADGDGEEFEARAKVYTQFTGVVKHALLSAKIPGMKDISASYGATK